MWAHLLKTGMDDEEEPAYLRRCRMRREEEWQYSMGMDDEEESAYSRRRRMRREEEEWWPLMRMRDPVLVPRSRNPDAEIASTADADKLKVLDAVGRAKALRLCLRRTWAVAASLPDRENSLPGLIPMPGTFHIPGHDREHHEHEQCTFDFCEQSRVDFTSVAQHHEAPCRGKCEQITFPLQLLNERVDKGKPTAWKLDEPSLLEASQPYMAVSHVWSDGTGSGIWGPGKVNKCLYTFFSGIARSFQCEGCWWDSISIPHDDKARTKALGNMQINYSDARITLVHDLYLREWEWVDSETACFAIVMSPWYSRGWTALELAQSHKVKILFKTKNGMYVIKDLDVDILAEAPEDHATANAIRKLRRASIDELSTLLAILGARDTSKPRDVPIISGLLAGVDVSSGLSQQEIYQRILRKLGKVAQGNLFHNSATMSAPGFSWCPTNILDMPMAETDSAMLDLRENGDLEGDWRVQAIDSVKVEDLITRGTHPLTQVSLESAFCGKDMKKHVLLLETNEPKTTSNDHRALLVRLMEGTDEIPARFIGPVYFRAPPASKLLQIRVRIGSTDGLQDISEPAWDYVQKRVTEKTSPPDETLATGRSRSNSKTDALPKDAGALHHTSKDLRAVFFTEGVPKTSLFEKASQISLTSKDSNSKSQDDMEMFFYCDTNLKPSRAFFYGNQGMVHRVKTWMGENLEFITEKGQPVLLALGNDNEIKMDLKSKEDDARKNSLAGNALLLATEKGNESGIDMTALVNLLLDIKAPHIFNTSGQKPLHVALEGRNYGIAETLLRNESSPVPVDAKTLRKSQTALHLAAKYRETPNIVYELLIQKSENADAKDELQRTALHYAAESGNFDMAKMLLSNNANPNIRDSNAQVALHYAANKGFDEIVRLLLEPAEKPPSGSEIREAMNTNDGLPSGRTSRATGSDTSGVSGHRFEEEADDETDGEVDRSVTSVDGTFSKSDTKLRKHHEPLHPDVSDSQERTPLHLAAEGGHESVVSILLDFGADPCAVARNGQKPLLLAAKSPHSHIVEKLLKFNKDGFEQEDLDKALLLAAVEKNDTVISELHKYGARSNRAVVYEGMTALHWTIRTGFEASAELLIQSQDDADIDVTDDGKKQSALLMASGKGLTSVVTLLLDRGADIKLRDCHKRTALHLAVLSQSTDVTNLIAKQPQCRHHIYDEDGRTALVIASEMGLKTVVNILLEGGSDPTLGKDGRTALERAAALGRREVVEKLLTKVEAHDLKQRALRLAARAGHLSVAILLHESIKDASRKASTFRTIALAIAANHRDNSVPFEQLLSFVTDPNIQDDEGRSLLMLAIDNSHRRLAVHLSCLRLKTDLRDNEDKTALMVAAIKDDAYMVETLLDNGANPDLVDKKGYTALHYAVENGCCNSFIELLDFSNSSFKTIQDCQRRTALHIVLEKIRQSGSFMPNARSMFWSREVESPIEAYKAICVRLIQCDIRLEVQDDNGRNALHLAVAQNLVDIARILLRLRPPEPLQRNMDTEDVEGQTPLLLAAAKGYTALVDLMLSRHFRSDTKDKNGQTPLLLTAQRGDDGSVIALLNHGADPNHQNKHGRTALSQAAQNGHENVVESLLRNHYSYKTNLNARDNMGQTALILAAENGHASIVKILLDRSANVDVLGYDGKKAWQKAADKGHTTVVKILLSNKDAPIQDRQAVNNALLLASRRGWADLVRVLLEQEVDLTFQGSGNKWTALHIAATSGHREVLEMLIADGVDIVIKDRDGRTALFQATKQGFESIVGVLLKRKEIKTDIEAWMGQESLLFAAEKGYGGIVKLLLDSGVYCDATDASDRTAMVLAAANGNAAIVKMLLERGASWAIKDKNQRTALHHAAWGGHHSIVETLLTYRPPVVEGGSVVDSSGVGTALTTVDFSVVDNGGQSALHLAAERASVNALEKLLGKRANVNARCKDGQTVLHRAAWGGSCEVVRLLRRSSADPFMRDNHGKKPWHIAAEKGYEIIAVELLREEKSAYEERILDEKGLIFAAKMGYTRIAHCLLEKNADATVKDNDGRTPLHWAAARGNIELAKLLINHGEVSVNAVDYERRTALCLAVLDDRIAAAGILLQSGIDADVPDAQGQTALHHAAQRGNEEIAQMLVDHKADPHIHDNFRRKAWQLAAENGYHQVVRLLIKKEIDLNPHNQRREELFLKMSGRDLAPMVQLLLDLNVDKNVKDRIGRTAIGLAAENGADNVLRLLLLKGADPTIADSHGQTPLLWVAKAGNANIVSLLLDKITSQSNSSKRAQTINKIDGKGRTALVIAIENKHDKAVKLLLDKCRGFINVNAQDKAQRTALQLAAEMGNNSWVQLLLDTKAETGHKDSLGRTALLVAAEQGHTEVVKSLLQRTDNHVNDADKEGRTALHAATDRGNRDMVATLLDAYSDPGVHDARGRTPLLLAAEHGDKAIVDLLLARNASQERDVDGRTPLLLAVANGDKAVVEALINHRGADPDAKDARGRSLLHLAVESGNRDVAWLVAKMVTSRANDWASM